MAVRFKRLVPIVLLGLLVVGLAGSYLGYRLWLGWTSRKPVIVGIVARFPGASAEEVERQVTVPLEVTLAGMTGLRSLRSRSLFGVSHLTAEFEDGVDQDRGRQFVIDRLQFAQPVPPTVEPTLLPATDSAVLRYTLTNPKDAAGRPVYSLGDLRALQDFCVDRELLRVPGVVSVASSGGWIPRYEIHVDPDRLRRYGITLEKLKSAIADSSGNTGRDIIRGGEMLHVGGMGIFGRGNFPLRAARDKKTPEDAAGYLRAEEKRILLDIRKVVVARVNNVPVCVGDLVEGGPLQVVAEPGRQGVVVGHGPSSNRIDLSRQKGKESWNEERVQSVLLLRLGEDRARTRRAVLDKVKELNETPGTLLPGVQIEPYAEETDSSARPLWAHGTWSSGVSLAEAARTAGSARALLLHYDEIEGVVSEIGRSDDLVPTGSGTGRFCVLLRPERDWPAPARTRKELLLELESSLTQKIPGVDWRLSEDAEDDPREAFAPPPGVYQVKIFGPDLTKLAELAESVRQSLQETPGSDKVRILNGEKRRHQEIRLDLDKCRRWGVTPTDINQVLKAGLDGLACSRLIAGDQTTDVTLLWPARLRKAENLLEIPLDLGSQVPGAPGQAMPRLRLKDCLSSEGNGFRLEPAVIYRENGQRVMLVRFRVTDRSRAAVIADAFAATTVVQSPYRIDWGNR